MYEYKVEIYHTGLSGFNGKKIEKEMNEKAKQGWRVISTASGDNFMLAVTYEREK